MIKRMMKIVGMVGLVGLMGCVKVGGNRSPVSLVRDINDKTVALVANVGNGRVIPYCTGVWVSEREIMTAGHCARAAGDIKYGHDDDSGIEDLDGLEVDYIVEKEVEGVGRTPNGQHMSRVVELDEAHDLALLRVVGDVVPAHGVGKMARVSPGVGERVHCVGQVRGLYWSYVEGVVSAYRKDLPENRKPVGGGGVFVGPFMQVSMPVYFGNSGGGLFNDDGELVGIVSFLGGAPVTSMFVHLDTMRKMMNRKE